MARRVRWSPTAKKFLKDALRYWADRTASKEASANFYNRVQKMVHLISIFPEIGVSIERSMLRSIGVDRYKIIYLVKPKEILIAAFWDSRQDPNRLNALLIDEDL
jgi:plasmid stabilization system protein ParE